MSTNSNEKRDLTKEDTKIVQENGPAEDYVEKETEVPQLIPHATEASHTGADEAKFIDDGGEVGKNDPQGAEADDDTTGLSHY